MMKNALADPTKRLADDKGITMAPRDDYANPKGTLCPRCETFGEDWNCVRRR
jgi:hypothetical protein